MRLRALCTALLVSGCLSTGGGSSDDQEATGGTPPPAAEAPVEAPGDTPPEETPPSEEPASVLPTEVQASRFLVQSTFGPTPAEIDSITRRGFEDWIAAQMQIEPRSILSRYQAAGMNDRHALTDLFWEYAIEGDDQLRQRAAFALSQIVVVSLDDTTFVNHPEAFAVYMDLLQEEAFGNYLDIVREVTLLPAMGTYLSHLGSRKADAEAGFEPDENYAREVMQLFTIGLEELNPDGTPTGAETYTVDDVKGLAAVFTGFSWADADFRRPWINDSNRVLPMEGYGDYHESAPKRFLGVTVDAGANPAASVEQALDHLLAHSNIAPFVTKQLIQRMVTANPSPAYVERVATAFDQGLYEGEEGTAFGTGRRGDLAATFAAILLDEEARSDALAESPEHGRVREPVLRFAHFARTFKDDLDTDRAGVPEHTGVFRRAGNLNILGQQAYGPPSVFGFTRPGYVPPASWASENDLVAPGLALANGATLPGFIDTMAKAAKGTLNGTNFFDPDYEGLTQLADQPDALLDELDLLLTYGTLTEDSRQRIARALDAVRLRQDHLEIDRLSRVQLAVLMTTTTPEYAVQR